MNRLPRRIPANATMRKGGLRVPTTTIECPELVQSRATRLPAARKKDAIVRNAVQGPSPSSSPSPAGVRMGASDLARKER